MSIMLTQITEEDVERSSTLEPEDVGKGCLIIHGTFQGFWESKPDSETINEILEG